MTQPVAPDPAILRRLVLVKRIYLNASERSQLLHNQLDHMLALIEYDYANETCVKAVFVSLDTSGKAPYAFPDWLNRADELYQNQVRSTLPYKLQVSDIHKLRNDLQHQARYPNLSDVIAAGTTTKAFLTEVILNLWGVNFNTLSLVEFVKNPKAKAWLVSAEQELAGGNFAKAAELAFTAFIYALFKVRRVLVGNTPELGLPNIGQVNIQYQYGVDLATANAVQGGMQHLSQNMTHFVGDALKKVKRTVELLQQTLLFTTLNLDYADFANYFHILGGAIQFYDDEPGAVNVNTNIQAADAAAIVTYCTESLIQIESKVQDIERPFIAVPVIGQQSQI